MTRRRLWISLALLLLFASIALLWARYGEQIFLAAFGGWIC